jgi:hypothetical protein
LQACLAARKIVSVGDDAMDWKFYAIGATTLAVALGALATLLWTVVA